MRNYTDQAIENFELEATGGFTRVDQLAVVEFAAGLIGRSFALAKVEGDGGFLTPQLLEIIGREFIRAGESCFEIGANELYPSRFDITGNYADPNDWQYKLWLTTPGGQVSYGRVGANVLHFRANCSSNQPYKGQPPWRLAKLTGKTALTTELASSAVAENPTFTLMQWDAGSSRMDDAVSKGILGKLSAMFNRGQRLVVRPYSAAAGGTPTGGIFQSSPDPKSGLVNLRHQASRDLLAACGIPPSMAERAEGSSLREATREFQNLTLEPLARIVTGELERKLDLNVSIHFDRLATTDLSSKGRAIKQLTDSGMSLGEALEKTGLA